jgi:outer membrane protein OmpA-like peptidoglycan-associated protein
MLKWVIFMLIGITSFGCTSVPTLSEHQAMEEYDGISAYKERLSKDLANGLFDFAPKGFQEARARLVQAISLGRSRNTEMVTKTLAEGHEIMNKAESDARLSKELMREVLSARRQAMQVNADAIQQERLNELDNQLRKASELVEEGDIESAKKLRPAMLDGYAQIELEALKQDATEYAMRDITLAIRNKADVYAPLTLKRAKDELALASAVLENNRNRRNKAKKHALVASQLAKRSIEITELVKDFEQRDYSLEEVVLWYQKQLRLIHSPLGEGLSFDRPNHEIVQTLHEKFKRYVNMQKQQAQMATKLDLESWLAAVERENREAQRRFDKIQDLFNPYEANVYRQGHNVLLELHTFHFPSGGTDIQEENFTLLDKIVTAVNLFPRPNVVVSGHTDSVGSAQTNQKLSKQRAETIASFLEKVGGVKRTSLTSIGYGETRPVANNETAAGRKSNRRIEVLIINE